MIKGFLGKKLLLCFCLFASGTAFSQAPQSINYQAVARNTESGEELINQSLFIAAKVLANGPQGDIVYQENHSGISTNAFGLFTLQIGEGSAVVGQFDQIEWAQGDLWLEIDLDIGNGLETIGSMQFVSVPYALYAENVANVDDADADPENEAISEVGFSESSNNLVITEAGENFSVDLTSLKNDADADPLNEVITSMDFDSVTSVLTIDEAGNENQITLNYDVNDADADPANELINANGLVLSGTTLQITEGGIQNEVDLSDLVNDADSNPENELINSVNGLVLDGDTMLQITEGGVLNEVDLSPLQDDEDWLRPDDGNAIFNVSDRVGVGTSNPNSTFHVNGSVAFAPVLIVPGSVNETYVVSDQDYAIVCNCGGTGDLSIEMPDPASIPGRVINIIRTGPFSIQGDVNISFNGAPVDFIVQDFTLVGPFGTVSLSFMSLGADGWILLYQE